MNIYISSSWKNRDRVRALAEQLRAQQHNVYDFTDAASRAVVVGGPSVEIPPEAHPEQWLPGEDGRMHRDWRQGPVGPITYEQYLRSVPRWSEAVQANRRALRWCDVCVLLLPCGDDAHANWGVAVGLGKKSCVVGHPGAGKRTPSHLWADAFLERDEDVVGWLAQRKEWVWHGYGVRGPCIHCGHLADGIGPWGGPAHQHCASAAFAADGGWSPTPPQVRG